MKPCPHSAPSFQHPKTSIKPHLSSSHPSLSLSLTMAFLIPTKPSSNSSTPSSSYDDDRSLAHGNVTSFLSLRPKGSNEAANGSSLEKKVVLRRIRHRKRVNRIRGAIRSFFTVSAPEQGEKEREADGWLEDAFSSP